jgi:hypothetical protein
LRLGTMVRQSYGRGIAYLFDSETDFFGTKNKLSANRSSGRISFSSLVSLFTLGRN